MESTKRQVIEEGMNEHDKNTDTSDCVNNYNENS